MKTEMKKNNKMVMALAVIAAFAMISVAGIALSDDSAAAKISNNILIQPGETSTTDYDFYVKESNLVLNTPINFVFKVNAGGSYTGTVQIGTLTDDEVTYTPYSSLKMAGAGAVIVYATVEKTDSGILAFFTITNIDKKADGAMPAGTYELTKGQIVLGYAKAAIPEYEGATFCGKIKVGDFTATANYVLGTILALDSNGKARISGAAVSPAEVLPFASSKSDKFSVQDGAKFYPSYDIRTLVLEGAASLQFPESFQKLLDDNISAPVPAMKKFMNDELVDYLALPAQGVVLTGTSFDAFATDSVNVTVEAGAVITAGGSDRSATVASSVAFETEATTVFDAAFLVSSDGKVYPAVTIAAGLVTFGNVPFGTYTLVAYELLNAQIWYSSNATVAATSFSLGSGLGVTSAPAVPLMTATYDDDNNPGTPNVPVWGFKASDYSFQFALDTTVVPAKKLSSKIIVADDGGVAISLLVFVDDTGTIVTAPDDIVFVGRNRATSNGVFFQGTIGSAVNNLNVPTTLASGAAPPATFTQIKAPNSNAATSAGALVMYKALDDLKLVVKGEMNFLYTSATVKGDMYINSRNAALTFEGDGIIAYGVAPQAPTPVFPVSMDSSNMVAAYYFVNDPATGTPTKSTYYFTSLANAIKKSNNITLLGKHVILVDTTLDNPEFTSITITLGAGASLEVGRVDDPSTDENEFAAPKLTVPAKTTIVVPSWAHHYSVISGQAIYDIKPGLSDEPAADILIEGSKYIYTDLATALDISVSGDKLNLRQNAPLIRSATVKTGVVLDDKGYAITIEEDVVMTVAGELKSTGAMVIDGTIRISGKAGFNSPATATFGPSGVIDIISGGVLTVDNARIEAIIPDNGAFIVAGEMIVRNGSVVSARDITVIGKLTVTGLSFTAYEKAQIGAQPDLSPLSGTYNNTASITGAITLGPTAVAYVYGSFAVGSKITGAGPIVKTECFIEDNLYMTLYAVAGVDIPLLYEDQLKDIRIKDWNNDRYLRGDSLRTFLGVDIGQVGPPSWQKIYAEYEWKKYEVSCDVYLGVTWSVNGTQYSVPVEIEYGKNVVVKALVQPGYEGTPTILINHTTTVYNGNAYKVTEPVNFSLKDGSVVLAGEKKDDGLTLIEILLIIIVIIIGIIALIVAVRLLRS